MTVSRWQRGIEWARMPRGALEKSYWDPVHTQEWELQGVGGVVGRGDPINKLR